MAERYRKGEGDRVRLDCTVSAETKLKLFEIAGEFSVGDAIERLVKKYYRRTKSSTKATQKIASY